MGSRNNRSGSHSSFPGLRRGEATANDDGLARVPSMSETSAAALRSPDTIDWSAHEPRTTGEVISDAVSVLRRHFPVVFSLAVPFCAVDVLLREVSQSFMAGLGPVLLKTGGASPEELLAALPDIGIVAGFLAAAFATQQVLMGAVTVVGEQAFAGRPASAREALARMAVRGGPLILTSLLFMLVLAGTTGLALLVPTLLTGVVAVQTGFVPLIFVGLGLGLLGSLVVLLVLTLRWSLYAPAVVCEGRSLFSAMARSSALTAPRGLPFFDTPRFRLSVLLLIALGISSVLQSLFVVPRLVVAFVTGWSFSNGGLPGLSHLPLWFGVPFGLIEVVTNAAVIPLSGLLLALFAFDLRVRYEHG